MITALLIAALILTALLAISLPFGGWGSGMDAAGRGMAMFFPFIFMMLRVTCFAAAVVVLATRDAFEWSGLPPTVFGGLALVFLGGAGASSFAAASLVAQQPGAYGRGTYTFLATIVAPVLMVIWLFSEAYDVEPGQAWIARGLVILAGIGPLPLLLAVNRHAAEKRVLADAAEKTEEEAAQTRAAQLPADATFLQALEFHDSIPEAEWRARGLVLERVTAMPEREAAFMQVLLSGDWPAKIRAGFHVSAVSPTATTDYFNTVQPIVEAIVRHLEDPAERIEDLVAETSAAIRLAWPAIHTDKLPRPLMIAFLAAIEARAEGGPLSSYTHDAKMLAEYVNG